MSSERLSAVPEGRVIFLDWLRFIACFMVIATHCGEPFYLGGDGTLILDKANGLWVTFLNSFFRPCVPLFAIASGYLLFPLPERTDIFIKKRIRRIFIPLVIWIILYALAPAPWNPSGFNGVGKRLAGIIFNFPSAGGHLWFVYMILGLYIGMILFSPWIEKVSRKGERAFIIVWLLSCCVPLFRVAAEKINGVPGVWGEASWNEFGTLYYVCGFIGFIVLAHYIRKYVGDISWGRLLGIGIPVWLAGFAITAGSFWVLMPKDFPVNGPIDIAVKMETMWDFTVIGVVMMAVVDFLLIRKITSSGKFYRAIVLPISRLSLGMYLLHMFLLVVIFARVSELGIGTPATILFSAVATFIFSWLAAWLIDRIPGLRKCIGM